MLREETRSGDKSRKARYIRRSVMFISISGRCATTEVLEASIQYSEEWAIAIGRYVSGKRLTSYLVRRQPLDEDYQIPFQDE